MNRATACAAIALSTVSLALAAPQKFHSGIDIVRVDALVTDGRKPISGLTREAFELRDNGVPQTIDSVEVETLPVSVIFVLDTSGSVAGDKMRHLNEAVNSIVGGLHGEDRAALVTFSHRVWVRTPLMSDFAALRAMMATATPTGGTSLHDAVYAALAISEVEDSRPLLVVFSDGLDNMSWMSADVVENAARRANAVIYAVTVAAGTRMEREASGKSSFRLVPHPVYAKGQTGFLEAVAAATGGRVLRADSTGTLPEAFAEILQEFRTRYVVTYTPRRVDAAGWHRIELRVKDRRADIRARAGYQK